MSDPDNPDDAAARSPRALSTSPQAQGTVGFIGTGVMGRPMALNLLRAGVDVVVWNRTRAHTEPLEDAGARVVDEPAQVFAASRTVILMLVSADVIDAVLRRRDPDFEASVHGRTVINMATTPPDYSTALEADLRAAGARYLEAPVSGQRPVAESGRLMAMVAGDPDVVAAQTPLLRHMCRTVVECGVAPNGLLMKLAVNLVSGTVMTVLAEGMTYARSLGLDPGRFAHVLDASPLSSDFVRMKTVKLVEHDFTVQGALGVARKDLDIIAATAGRSGASTPLMDACRALWDEAITLGLGQDDVASVQTAYEARASRAPGRPDAAGPLRPPD